MANHEVAIKVTEAPGHFFAELCYRGKVFRVPGEHCRHIDALRGADAYRETFCVPSEETLTGLDAIANDLSPYWTPLAAQLRDVSLDAAWRRR